MSCAKLGIRRQTTPAKPAIPEARELLRWMYGNPADVVERLELQAVAKVARQEKERARRRPEEAGLTPGTVLNMRRLRIRELVAKVMTKGGAR